MSSKRVTSPAKADTDVMVRSSRRQFLVGAGTAALSAALPASLVEAAAGFAAAPARASSSRSAGPNWSQLERHLAGKLLRHGTGGYGNAIKIRNLRYAATRPAGVAMVSGAKDITTALAWAQDNGIDMVSRSGGHSYAGYSTTPGLVIDLNGMTNITIDHKSGTMTTIGAATNEDVARAGKPHALTLPGGQCPTVGVPGFVLGGGIGFYMREHGLAIDSLKQTTMVTADGRHIKVSESEHSDLFWALRGGGGGNFGVNTSFTFKTFRVPNRVTVFSLTWVGDDCVRAFLAFQTELTHAPETLGAIAHFSISASSKGSVPSLRVFGQLAGSEQATHHVLGPVIAAAKPTTVLVQEKSFWAAKVWLGKDEGPPNAFAERSRYCPEPVSEEGIHALISGLSKAPIGTDGKMSVASVFFACGGAVAKVSKSATAYVHRDDFWLQAFGAMWDLRLPSARIAQLLAWQDEFFETMTAYSSRRSYQNFIDPQLADPMDAYYAENQVRLTEVKWKYDPHNAFRFAQSIRS